MRRRDWTKNPRRGFQVLEALLVMPLVATLMVAALKNATLTFRSGLTQAAMVGAGEVGPGGQMATDSDSTVTSVPSAAIGPDEGVVTLCIRLTAPRKSGEQLFVPALNIWEYKLAKRQFCVRSPLQKRPVGGLGPAPMGQSVAAIVD